MNFQFLLAAVLFVAVTFVSAQQIVPENLDCSYCDLSKCKAVGECPAGKVRDICGCCEVCGLEEGKLCSKSATTDVKVWYGFCGYDMECKKPKGFESREVNAEGICTCEKKGFVCGSDGVTYTPCQFYAAQSKHNITQKDDQPCQTRPKIVTLSESESVLQGSRHTILCEVRGFPLPKIQWLFMTPGSTEPQILPGNSQEVSVSVRGGPEKMHHTSYLQIEDFQLQHEGNYECLVEEFAAQNIDLVLQRSTAEDL